MKNENDSSYTGLEAAVIGMAGRFPGAGHIYEFWENLVKGRESIAFFTAEELEQAGFEPGEVHKENYVKAKGIYEGAEYFDAQFFGYIPSEAESMAPEIRIFHECVWEGLEDAGYSLANFTGRIGLYAGSSSLLGWEGLMLLSRLNNMSEFFSLSQIREKDFLSTRISYKLGLSGPVYTLSTACSTSLAAVHLGVQALVNGECEMVVAGGISTSIPNKSGYLYQEGMVLSPDGSCRPFDARAAGTIPGEGAGVVVLKSMAQALEERDHIYALVKASAANNDGNRKVGFTAPSVEAQAEAIIQALYTAEVDPRTICYVEAHGTGTPLGDPVEIEALTLAFNTDQKQFCSLGSVKSNIGHLDAAAGIVGLIKAVLVIYHRKVPPTLHFEHPNPDIDFDNSPFYVNTRLTELKNQSWPLRAGVSSLGIGGTNVHVILEEAPEIRAQTDAREHQLILLSAKTETALEQITQNLVEYLKQHPGISLADAAYTLQVGRERFPYRKKCICTSVSEIIQRLTSQDSRQVQTHLAKQEENQPVVFMFPGLGFQYTNMGRGLYDTEPIFRQEMDRCFEILKDLVDYNLKEILYPGCRGGSPCPPQDGAGSPGQGDHRGSPLQSSNSDQINQPEITQLIVFFFEYSLAKLLIQWGIKPHAMIGYSFGEYAAACISGIFTLEQALELILKRSRLLARLPRGKMLSVPLDATEVEPLLEKELSIGIDNGSSCVVSGPVEAVTCFEEQMKKKRVVCMLMDSTHGIHSPMMDSILEIFEKTVANIPLKPPQIPYISTVTGNWIKSEDAVSPGYWARQLRETVRFSHGIQVLLKQPNTLFLEVGAGHDLAALVKRHADDGPGALTIPLVRAQNRDIPESYYLLDKIGLLWLYGVTIDWTAYSCYEPRYRLPLPTYPFQGKPLRKYIEDFKAGLYELQPGKKKEKDQQQELADCFYVPCWKPTITPLSAEPGFIEKEKRFLVFINPEGVGTGFVNYLKQHQNQDCIITVSRGNHFSRLGENQYVINPTDKENYDRLIAELLEKETPPDVIVHFWGVTPGMPADYGIDFFKECQETGFYSLLFLTQSMVKHKLAKNLAEITGPSDYLQLEVVVNQVYSVTGEEELYAEKAPVTALCKTIPQEYPNFRCRVIDIQVPASGTRKELKLFERLAAEFQRPVGNLTAAYRGTTRWVMHFEPLKLDPLSESSIPGLKPKGVYLITGGLGNDSFMRAKYLARSLQARLVLVGRSELPEKEYWQQYLFLSSENDEISKKIKRVMELEQLGTEVLVIPADVADEPGMQRVMSEIHRVFGRLDGVIHAAGVTGIESSRLLMDLGVKESEWHFSPKVHGLYVLEKVLADRDIDFCLLTSSVASIIGGIGLSAYTAASIFMDIFTRRHNSQNPIPWISLNWQGSPEKDTVEAFKRVLSVNDVDQLVFSRIHPDHLIREKIQLQSIVQPTYNDNKALLESRPDLSNPYKAPGNELEQKLTNIWEGYFGIVKIGVNDDLFDLGGDSLKAINILNIIKKELNITIPLNLFFDNSTIAGAARYIMNAEEEQFIPIEPAEEREYYPLSSSQKRLFILQRMDKASVTYNSPQILELVGEPNRENLEKAFWQMIQRHESLRTSFDMINREPIQRIHNEVEFEMENHDLYETRTKVKVKIHSFIRPFDLSLCPLSRCGLVKIDQHQYLLMIDTHHIITDAVSNSVFIKEMVTLYAGESLPGIKIRYRDYALWQNSSSQRTALKKQEAYWVHQFQEDIPVLNLPLDNRRPTIQEFAGSGLEFQLDETGTRGLKDLAVRQDVTLFMTVLAIYYVFLNRVTGQEDIIVGTPVAGRRHLDLRDSIGVFINTLAIKNCPAGDKTFNTFLQELRTSSLKAFENQEYPFEDLVEKVICQRDTSRNPLFDVMFVHQDTPFPAAKLPGLPGLKIKPYEYHNRSSKFELTLHAVEAGGKLLFNFEYQTGLFQPQTIKRFSHWLLKIIYTVSADPEVRIAQIDILSLEEKNQLLVEFNDTHSPYPGDKSIHELFTQQVEQIPDQIALVGRQQTPDKSHMSYLSYTELNKKATEFTRFLIEKGVLADSIVGIKMERSVELIIGILGILKAGGAYLPIDPKYPQDRIDYMLADSAVKILLTSDEINRVPTPLPPSTPLPVYPSLSSRLAYVIYTSGSTGRPKGVMVEHRNVIRLVKNSNFIDLAEGDRFLMTGAIAFDISTFEIWGSLTNGLSLFLADRSMLLERDRLAAAVKNHDISILHLIPQLFDQLAARGLEMFAGLKVFLVGGDLVQPYYVNELRKAYPQLTILHMYGPTENTTFSTFFPVEKCYETRLPIGKPIINSSVYILDPYGGLVPIGKVGELCVGGQGIARGYLNNPDLTTEKFKSAVISHSSFVISPSKRPSKSANNQCPMTNDRSNKSHMSYMSYKSYIPQKIYKTGDMARWLKDGNIEFSGRIDGQVKIRGIRIELGEIENRLLQRKEVKEAVILSKEANDKEKYLCAYIVPGIEIEDSTLTSELKQYLSHYLPDYMIPTFIIKINRIPLTPHGKIDSNALPVPGITMQEPAHTVPPTPIEKKLLDIWSTILCRDASHASPKHVSQLRSSLGIHDNFFELGGHSLKAMELISIIHKELKVKIPLQEVFNRQTLQQLASYIEQSRTSQYVDIEPVEKKEYHPLSSAQKRLYFLQQLDINSTAYNMPLVLPLSKNIETTRLETALKKLVLRHESLRTSFIIIHDQPVQRIHNEVEFEIEFHYLYSQAEAEEGTRGLAPLPLEPATRNSQPATALINSFIRPFDLARAPLIRSVIIKLADNTYTWMVDVHHIVSDGTSHVILTGDFFSLASGEGLEPLRIQYKDFAYWQNHVVEAKTIKLQENYWLNLYKDSLEIPRLNLPTDYKRPEVFTFSGARYNFVLDREEVVKFKKLGASGSATLYMNLLAVLNTLFYKYTGQTDIIIGSGTAGRPHIDLQKIVGMFVNTLAMRNHPKGEKTYGLFLQEVVEHSVKAFENQDVQFEELVEKLELERNPGHNPLFDVTMVVQNLQQQGQLPGNKENTSQFQVLPGDNENLIDKSYENLTSKFDLTFFVQEQGQDVFISIEYYTAIFKAETIRRLTGHLKKIITSVVKEPAVMLKDIDILSREEKQQLIFELSGLAREGAADKTIHEHFEMQVKQKPDHIALVGKEEGWKGRRVEGEKEEAPSGRILNALGVGHLSYRELNQKANQTANYLKIEKQLQPEEPVGVLMERSPFLLVVLLGILKAGGAYVPLDPDSPEERLKDMIREAALRTVISQNSKIRVLNRLQWECPTFSTFLSIDSSNVHSEKEKGKSGLMEKQLWEYVSETAEDDINGGGWLTSTTGQPFSRAEMDEYGDNVLKKLKPFLNKTTRVLEIGCASGLTMYRLAPLAGFYYGTDLSRAMIEKNKKKVEQQGFTNIKLTCIPAHDIHKLEEKDFDLVIINSVIQSFHGHNYLRNVIHQVLNLMKPHAFLFIGDVMDQDLKEDLIRWLKDFKRAHPDKNYKTKTDWSEELFISRAFFEDLVHDYPGIRKVEFSDKIYTIKNELTLFRYDALLQIDKETKERESRRKRVHPRHKYQEDATVLQKYQSQVIESTLQPRQLAYIVYTSGSTGKPKGVMVAHNSVMRLVKDTDFIRWQAGDRLLPTGSIAFDISTFEIWAPLLNGIPLVLVDKMMILEGQVLHQVIQTHQVTHLHLIPQLFNQLAHEHPGIFASINYFLVGGDRVNPMYVNKIREKYKHLNILHMYGPTENTTFSTFFQVKENYEDALPLGRPIANSTVYIMDSCHQLQPIGVYGELCTGGQGVARGYLNNPQLTAEKFCPVSPGFYRSYRSNRSYITHLSYYKSGDLARWNSDLLLEFSGRIDRQVKIRGFRVEEREIENRLLAIEGIQEAVVTTKEDQTGQKCLCAYIVSPGELDLSDINESLSKKLPDYMVPAYITRLDRLPLTPTGKINRKALPAVGFTARQGYAPPRDEIEKKLTVIWSEVLGINTVVTTKIGIDDNFFQLGGHSLKATILAAKIHKGLNAKVPLAEIFKTPTIRGLAGYIKSTAPDKYSSIKTVEKREYYRLSSAQKRLYFLQRVDLNSTAYNTPLVLPLPGDIQKDRLELLLKQLIARHESLRTSYIRVNEVPVQRIHNRVEFAIEYYDLTTNEEKYKLQITNKKETEGTHHSSKNQIIHHSFVRPFDLTKAPLFRSGLIKSPGSDGIWLLDMHHIISDGTSLTILTEDFMSLLKGEELEPLRLQYKDFSGWQNRLFDSGMIKEQETYWLELYRDSIEIPRLNLPIDYKRPKVFNFKGSRYEFRLGSEYAEKFKALDSAYGGTLYMNILAVLNALFYKYSGQGDIVIGTGIAGRPHIDLQHIMGMFINTLAMRNSPQGEKTFESFLKEVIQHSIKAFDNQDVQFEDLVEKLALPRDPSRNPLFDITMVVQNFRWVGEGTSKSINRFEALPTTGKNDQFNTTSKFDMTFFIRDLGTDLDVCIEYYTALFKPGTIKRLAAHLKNIIKSVIREPGKKLKDIDIITEEEKQKILNEFNHTVREYPGDKTLRQLFNEQVEKIPDNIALTGYPGIKSRSDKTHMTHISYLQLNEKANQVACLLIEKGVLPDTIVAIMVERSLEMIIGLLSILKAGGAYFPIDPGYPAERIKYMMSDSRAKILLKSDAINRVPTPDSTLTLTSTCQVSSTNLAYVIYTSGSTGYPKGVMVEHGNVVRLVKNSNFIHFSCGDRLLLTGQLTFDITTFEIWGALLNGLNLFLVNQDIILDGEKLKHILFSRGINILHLVPQLFNQLVQRDIELFSGLSYFLVGGDLVQPYYVNELRKAYPHLTILHMYGPTENTTFSTFFPVEGTFEDILPIGRPISNSMVFILDPYLKPQVIGTAGELCVGGDGLARGYLNNPELTVEKFRIHYYGRYYRSYRSYKSYIPQKIYQTGDLARWLIDGNIEFLGRRDHQVKIRGFRIELGEIEAQLTQIDLIKAAAVIDREDKHGERRLYAYIVPGDSDLDPETGTGVLRAYLSQQLPSFMVPERFILVKQIPLTSNGKVDRKALAHLEIKGTGTGKDYVSPGDEVEYQIARVWEEVLERDRVGRNDNFFELGGNSLDIIRIVDKLKPLLGIDIPVTTLFEYPTLGVFSEFLKKGLMGVDSAQEQEHQDSPVMDESRRAAREWAKTTREKQQDKRQRRFRP